MKPERVELRGVDGVADLVKRVLRARLCEARALAVGLERRDKQSLHDFRIACKRLRYALERFETIEPPFAQAAERLALLQDALGDAHDRDVLLAILPPSMATTSHKLESERRSCVERATTVWSDFEQLMQALDSHRI